MIFTLATYATALVSFASILSQTHAAQLDVVVGGPGVLKFNPEFVNAAVGDKVVFSFRQKNHTATQSTLAAPCVKMASGFDSGFVPVADTNTAGPFTVAEFTVKDANPVWVFCAQPGHCSQGMVFAINPGDKFAQYKAAAMGQAAPAPAAPSAPAPAASGIQTVTATIPLAGGGSLTTTYGSFPGSAAPTAGVSTDHKVIVGGPGMLIYNPSSIQAQPGDTVTFEFHQKNHTVTQSTFANPCRALTLTSTTGQVGFDSGFMAVGDGATTFPTYVIQINDTAPVWAYCRQTAHCGQGMVFAVNSIESGPNNFDAFTAKAKALNGTSATTSATTPSTTDGSGAKMNAVGSGLLLAAIGTVFGLVL